MIAEEKERCLVFASNNPKLVLPDNLYIEINEIVSTPVGDHCLELVVTAVAVRKTPTVLTKAKPCGLSHPFKIA